MAGSDNLALVVSTPFSSIIGTDKRYFTPQGVGTRNMVQVTWYKERGTSNMVPVGYILYREI